MTKINFTLDSDVVVRGAGIVAKNIAVFTMILKQGNGVTMLKIITTLCAVVKKPDSKKKTIVRVDTVAIAEDVGKQIYHLVECQLSLKTQQKHL